MERARVNLDFCRNVGIPDRRRVRGLGLRPFVVYPPSRRGGRSHTTETETCSEVIVYVVLKLSKYTVLFGRRKIYCDLQ